MLGGVKGGEQSHPIYIFFAAACTPYSYSRLWEAEDSLRRARDVVVLLWARCAYLSRLESHLRIESSEFGMQPLTELLGQPWKDTLYQILLLQPRIGRQHGAGNTTTITLLSHNEIISVLTPPSHSNALSDGFSVFLPLN